MTAPSIKEALEPVLSFLDELAANAVSGKRQALNPIVIGGSAKLYVEGLRAALATFQPDGERREAIARIERLIKVMKASFASGQPMSVWSEDLQAVEDLASGLVQDEAGIRASQREIDAKSAIEIASYFSDPYSGPCGEAIARRIRSARDGGAET